MLFIQPAVVHMDDATPRVAEVQKVTPPSREIPVWRSGLAQLDTIPSNANQNSAAPGTTIGGTPGINTPTNGNPISPNQVGAAPPIPGAATNTPTNPNGNTYGTQQEPTRTNGVTAPVTPGVPGPGAGTGGSSGMAAPEMATPPAGNMDSGSSYRNLSSPYNSSSGGAGLSGTGSMGTTATPPSGGTIPAPGSTSVTPTPSTSGASGTR
jgi:hypothetical protein